MRRNLWVVLLSVVGGSAVWSLWSLHSRVGDIATVRLGQARPAATTLVAASQGARLRVVFFAGLEGSGHHLLAGVWQVLAGGTNRNTTLLPRLERYCDHYGWGTFERLKYELSRMRTSVVWTLPTEISYPFCGLKDSKTYSTDPKDHEVRMYTNHPNLTAMKLAAQESNADLHVIFMYRKMADVLLAGCENRLFEKCGPYGETIELNAGYLARDIAALSLENVHCSEYGNLPSMIKAFDAAYGPSMHSETAYRQVFRRVRERNESRTWQTLQERGLSEQQMDRLLELDENFKTACASL